MVRPLILQMLKKELEQMLLMFKKKLTHGELLSQQMSSKLFLKTTELKITQIIFLSKTQNQLKEQQTLNLLERLPLTNKQLKMHGEDNLLIKKIIQNGTVNTALHQPKPLLISKPLELLLSMHKKPPMSGEVSSQLAYSTEHLFKTTKTIQSGLMKCIKIP